MKRRQLLIGAICLAVAVVALVIVWRRRPVPPSELSGPQSAVANTESKFVGVQACRDCHPENVLSHSQTAHAHTFAATRDSEISLRLCDERADGGAPYGTYHYDCDAEGLMARLPDRFGERQFPLDFALGSGKNAVTFLTLLQEPSGETVGIEHRMTWYRAHGRLDVTPSTTR